jgi:hypothetical protein
MLPPDPATPTVTLRAPAAENTHWASTSSSATTSNTADPFEPVVADVGVMVMPASQAAVTATSGSGVGLCPLE